LEEFFNGLERYNNETGDPWAEYKNRFLKLEPAGRAHELACYDQLLAEECRPTRELGEWIAKRRELADIDALCKRGGK
jgi:hypothetical protein